MRIVITGQPNNLYRLKRSDLPADKDLTHSLFEYVNLSGFDLRDYDLRDTTVYNCNAQAVKLPEGKTNWMESRFTDWTGAKLPADVSDFNWDLMKAVFDQSPATGARETDVIAKAMSVGQDGTYKRSWNEILLAEEMEMGLTREEVHAANKRIMAGYPRLLTRLDKMQKHDRIRPGSQSPDQDLMRITPAHHNEELDLSGDILDTHDRWEQARHLESVYPGIRFYIAVNTPSTYVISVSRDLAVKDEEWWWSEIWHG